MINSLDIKLNPSVLSCGYCCASSFCCIVFGFVPIIFSDMISNWLPLPPTVYYFVVGGAIFLGVILFFIALFRAKPKRISLRPNKSVFNIKIEKQ